MRKPGENISGDEKAPYKRISVIRAFIPYTPKEMLDMGVFGGTYLNSVRDQLPFEWFTGDNVLPKGNRPDVSMNFSRYHRECLFLSGRKGWIMTDKLGWFSGSAITIWEGGSVRMRSK